MRIHVDPDPDTDPDLKPCKTGIQHKLVNHLRP
jgi:hypothetical protein